MRLTPKALEARRVSAEDDCCPLVTGAVYGCSSLGVGRVQTVRLAHGEEIFLQNVVFFRVVRGAVEAFGHTFWRSKEYIPVVLPVWTFSLPLKAIDPQTSLIRDPGEREHNNSAVGNWFSDSGYKTSVESADFPVLLSFRCVVSAFGSSPVKFALSAEPIIRPLTIPPKWREIASTLIAAVSTWTKSRPPVILISGDVAVGKSTFCCFLLNYMLNHMPDLYYLETDLGQPLLSVSGNVSLHLIDRPILCAPHSLVHAYPPVVSCCVAAVNPSDNPESYLWSVAQCSLRYHQLAATVAAAPQLTPIKRRSSSATTATINHDEPADTPSRNTVSAATSAAAGNCGDIEAAREAAGRVVPLIVNTHGWITGLGWQFVDSIGALTWADTHIDINEDGEYNWVEGESEKIQKSKELQAKQSNSTKSCHSTSSNNNSSSGNAGDTTCIQSTSAREEAVANNTIPALVDNPFIALVTDACGALPLPWCVHFEGLKRIGVAAAAAGGSKFDRPKSIQLRWLRFAAYFDPSYGWTCNFTRASEEEFFGRCLTSSHVMKPQLRMPPTFLKLDCKLLQLYAPNIEEWAHQHPSNLQVVLTGTLAALAVDESFDPSQHIGPQANGFSVCKAIKAWRCIGAAWIHTVDLVKKEVYLYTSQFLSSNPILIAVNTILIGNGRSYSWTPGQLPSTAYITGANPSTEQRQNKNASTAMYGSRGVLSSDKFASTTHVIRTESKHISNHVGGVGAATLGNQPKQHSNVPY